jgi:NTE family protein
MAYWDGLFSDNPPIQALLQRDTVGLPNLPQEIWVIKINPTSSRTIPTKANQIADRRNQCSGVSAERRTHFGK